MSLHGLCVSKKSVHRWPPRDLTGSFSHVCFLYLTDSTSLALSFSTQEILDKNVISLFPLFLELFFVIPVEEKTTVWLHGTPPRRWVNGQTDTGAHASLGLSVSVSLPLCLPSGIL